MDKFLRFMIIFLGSYLMLMWVFPPEEKNENIQRDDIEIVLSESEYTLGDLVHITVQNNLDTNLVLGSGTPPEQLKIEKYQNGEWIALSINDSDTEISIAGHQSQSFSYAEKNVEFFDAAGTYRVKIRGNGEKEFIQNIIIEEVGFFKSIWRIFFWKPVYNSFIGSLIATGRDLGLAVILLTIIIKLLLFIPTQAGMKAQRKMQTLQPELEKIKSRYAGNQQQIAMKTMELWKKHNVNPIASILPMLMQFPFLIALFYVIQDGLSKDQSFFLYSWNWIKDFDYTGINTNLFDILPLLQTPLQHLPSLWLPVLVGIVQYFAMKLSFAKMKEMREKNKNAPKGKGFMAEMQQEFAKMSGVFVYVLPIMVFGFTLFMPAAVGLYWLVSTAFSIGQQYAVNKIIDKEVSK